MAPGPNGGACPAAPSSGREGSVALAAVAIGVGAGAVIPGVVAATAVAARAVAPGSVAARLLRPAVAVAVLVPAPGRVGLAGVRVRRGGPALIGAASPARHGAHSAARAVAWRQLRPRRLGRLARLLAWLRFGLLAAVSRVMRGRRLRVGLVLRHAERLGLL